MKVETKAVGDVTIFQLKGDLINRYIAEAIRLTKKEIDSSSSKKIIMDFSPVGIIDSSGVGFVITIFKEALSKNGMLVIVNPNPQVLEVFAVLGISKRIPIFKSEADALKGMQAT